MTVETLMEMKENGKVELLHTSSRRGYLSRKKSGEVEEYNGKFGKGYILVTPRFDTTRYVNVTYYILINNN